MSPTLFGNQNGRKMVCNAMDRTASTILRDLANLPLCFVYFIYHLGSLFYMSLLPRKKFHSVFQGKFEEEQERRLKSMRSHLMPGEQVLDFGAGRGFLAKKITRFSRRYCYRNRRCELCTPRLFLSLSMTGAHFLLKKRRLIPYCSLLFFITAEIRIESCERRFAVRGCSHRSGGYLYFAVGTSFYHVE